MEMTRLGYAHCQLSCILHILVSLKTTSSLNLQCQSCGRSDSQLLVSRQVCLLPICTMQAVFGLVSAYRHAAVWDGIYLHFRLCLGC